MIEKLLRHSHTLNRHNEAPLRMERERFLAHLLVQGTSQRQVRSSASMLINAIQFLGWRQLTPMKVTSIRRVSHEWVSDATLHPVKPIDGHSARFFVSCMSKWLEFNGMLLAPERELPLYENVLGEFIAQLEGSGNISAATISQYGRLAGQFLDWVSCRKSTFGLVDLTDVEDYLGYKRTAGYKPRSIATACQSLRAFFRFSALRGWSNPAIARGIFSPAVPRYDPNPKGPPWSEVRRLIARPSKRTNAEVRARAILLLFSICGLRSSEVSHLLLSDFDWFEETFTVKRAKRGRVQRLPLAYEVGEAILEYLREVRPGCSCRHLFVTFNPPYRSVPISSMGTIVDQRMKRLAIRSPHRGPHSLRHSCATQLLHKGSSLMEIADFLGHRNTDSVSIYAKPSKAAVRKVALFSLGGLE